MSNGKTAIIIAGYYRSGTSALSGSLNDLGITIHGDADANEHNPKGFFESTDLIRFDMRVFEFLEMPWADIGHTPPEWFRRPGVRFYVSQLSEHLAPKFKNDPLVAVKHPHICRLLPVYAEAAKSLGYATVVLHTHRSPYEIASSQAKKNGLSRAHALLLWASYITEAERHSRLFPRAWVFYEDLLADPTGTVHEALDLLGLSPPNSAPVAFVTKALRRSAEVDGVDLHPAVGGLVAGIASAIEDRNSNPENWDHFSRKVQEMAKFLKEMGKSSNRSARGVGEMVSLAQAVAAQQATVGNTATHAVRPAERGDEAERNRIRRRIEAEGMAGGGPVTVMIVVQPEVAREQVVRTVNSLRNGWLMPMSICIYGVSEAADSSFGLGVFERFFTTADAMEAELYRAMSNVETAYVAAIAAGDIIEPDAVARLALHTQDWPAMIYTDEIVAAGESHVIRAKPSMDINRLRESCFVGDWVWYLVDTLRHIGGFNHSLAGAEEYDAQLRIVETGARIVRLPEALFARGHHTRRDATPIETSMQSAMKAIGAHLTRCGIAAGVVESEIGIPGLFSLVYDGAEAQQVLPMTIMLRLEGRTLRQVLDATNRLVPVLGPNNNLFFTVADQNQLDPAVAEFLRSAEETVVHDHPNIRICRLAGPMAAQIQSVRTSQPGHAVLVVDPAGHPECDDAATTLLAMVHSVPDAALVAARTFWVEENGATQLLGPLLFGATMRIGANRDGKNPGPGGWLAATHAVDGVDGPMVIIHPDVPPLNGEAASWTEICDGVAHAQDRRRLRLWTPRASVEVPRTYPSEKNHEPAVALTLPYRPASHHPSMSMIGDPLFLEGRLGLVDTEGSILLSAAGRSEDGRIIDMLRNARLDAGVCASFSPDPIDCASAGRAIAQGRRWIRVNPRYEPALPGSESRFPFEAVWTEPPPPETKSLVQSAYCHYATSQGIANVLRTLGARKVQTLQPRLRKSLWLDGHVVAATTKPSVMWIDEGTDVPWLPSVIAETKGVVDWIVISAADLPLPGYVAQVKPVVLEEQWLGLFRQFSPRFFIRPTPGSKWRDDYMLMMAAAAGCIVLAGRESPARDGLPVSNYLGSDSPERWRSAIERHARESAAPSQTSLDSLWFEATDYDWLVSGPDRAVQKVA